MGIEKPQYVDSIPSSLSKSSRKAKLSFSFTWLKGISSWFELLFAASPTWVDYLLIFLGTTMAIGCGIPFPLMGVIFGQLIDNFNSATCAASDPSAVNPRQYQAAINQKVVQIAYIGAILLVLIYGHLTCWNIVSQRLAQRMRVQYVSSMLRQPPSVYDVRQASGQVSSRLNGDITAIQAGTSEKVGNMIVTMSFFVTVLVIAFTKQPKLAGMLMSMIPAFLLSGLLGGKFLSKFFLEQSAKVAAGSSIASEALSHITVVQAFGAAPRLEAKFSAFMESARKIGKKKSAVAAVQTAMLYFISFSGNALAFWQGSRLIADSVSKPGSTTTVGSVYAVVYLLVDACVMLGGIAPTLPFLGAAVAAYQRLNDEIKTPSSIDGTSSEGDVLPPSKAKSVAFRNVSFEYVSRPGEPVLKNVNLEFPAGKYTAIVGLSGSGKSTVASLIARLYDPTEGVVELEGQDLRRLNVRSLRSFISFVQQEPKLFDRSILGNIALGLVNCPKPETQKLKHLLAGPMLVKMASKGRSALTYAESQGGELAELSRLIRRAAEQADAATFIERLEHGYGTIIGASGTSLSGGQKQRLALARALIRDPEILVLDEATSALDSASEHKVQHSVESAAAEQRTVICIAHRLSTIRNADNIVVMKAGQVVEQGSYEELLRNPDGEFAHMARLQTLGHVGAKDTNMSTTTLVAEKDNVSTPDLFDSEDTFAASRQSVMVDVPLEKDVTGKAVEKGDMDSKTKLEVEGTEIVTPFRSVFKGVAWLIRPSLSLVVIAITSAVIVGSTFTSQGILFGFVVGVLNPCQSTADRIREKGAFFAGMYFLVASVILIANFITWWTFGIVAEQVLFSLRALSLSSMLEQSIYWHSSNGRTPTNLLGVITKDAMAVSNFSGSTFGLIFAMLVNVLLAVIVSLAFAWKIALVCMAILPILLGTGFMQLRMLARYEEKHSSAFTKATSLATEAIESIRTVAVLSLERECMDSFERLLAPPKADVVRASAFTNIFLAISYSTGTFVNALAYWWGSQLIIKGEYTQRDFLIILVAMLLSAQLWSSMFALAPEFSRARLAFKRVMGVIAIGTKVQIDRKAPSASKIAHDIEMEATPKAKGMPNIDSTRSGSKVVFDSVAFSYPNRPDTFVLDGVSFTIKPNQFCGLVGPSGAGKSTIMNLVQRLYEPTSGLITIDDRDITSLSTSFRDEIALVPQDPSLFDGSIRFNVGLGAPPDYEASDAEIEQACRIANIHDTIIALPDKYDTECGPNASRLSGGQKQRVAIARALVRRPRLLLLDESTSALDAISEQALQEGLEKAAQGTTVIAITHRLRTVEKADVILVIEGGRIVDSGRHSELMQRRESYRLNAMQQMLQ